MTTKNILLFSIPFIVVLILVIIGVVFGESAVGFSILVIMALIFCYIMGKVLVEMFGD